MGSNFLQKQREEQRLRHAIDYVRDATRGIKSLTTSELERLNQILTARTDDTWRTEKVEIKLPTGRIQSISLFSNPIDVARKIIGQAFDMANNEDVEKAAVYLYLNLIENHLFDDANRRTAALAVQWLLGTHNKEIDTNTLLEIPLGDVRDTQENQTLSEKIVQLIQ